MHAGFVANWEHAKGDYLSTPNSRPLAWIEPLPWDPQTGLMWCVVHSDVLPHPALPLTSYRISRERARLAMCLRDEKGPRCNRHRKGISQQCVCPGFWFHLLGPLVWMTSSLTPSSEWGFRLRMGLCSVPQLQSRRHGCLVIFPSSVMRAYTFLILARLARFLVSVFSLDLPQMLYF